MLTGALDPNRLSSKPENVIYMDKTKMHSTQIMQPQYRNRHSFMIFGGYLLKQTFELAFSCAAAFSHSRPTFLSLDPSTFANPVPVGSVLYLTATVAYTYSPSAQGKSRTPGFSGIDSPATESLDEVESSHYTRIQIRVDSRVRDTEHGATKPTGQFNYTFLVEKDIRVMPRTYSEFMIWVDARRRAARVSASGNDVENGNMEDSEDDGKKERITE